VKAGKFVKLYLSFYQYLLLVNLSTDRYSWPKQLNS